MKKIIEKIKSFPFNTMTKFAEFHNNLNSFEQMFFRTWFIFALVSVPLACLCAYVDFEVLFGIYYDSSQDYVTAFVKSLTEAVLIQLGILVAGGLAIKILINGKVLVWGKQFLIFFILAGLCISRTFYLSYQTYYSSKANAQINKEHIEAEHKREIASIEDAKQRELSSVESWYNSEKDRIALSYSTIIKDTVAVWENKIEQKKAKYKRKEITKSYRDKKIAAYNIVINGLKTHYNKQIFNEHNELEKERKSNVGKISEKFDKQLSMTSNENYAQSMELKSSINKSAKSTQGRNIGLNIISLLLQLGLMYYAKGVNKENNTIGDEDTEDEDSGESNSDTGEYTELNTGEELKEKVVLETKVKKSNPGSTNSKSIEKDRLSNLKKEKVNDTENSEITKDTDTEYSKSSGASPLGLYKPDTGHKKNKTQEGVVGHKNGFDVYLMNGKYCVQYPYVRKDGHTYLDYKALTTKINTYRGRSVEYGDKNNGNYNPERSLSNARTANQFYEMRRAIEMYLEGE